MGNNTQEGPQLQTANFYPSCTRDGLVERLMSISPCIDITMMNTSLLLQDTDTEGDTSRLQKLIEYANDVKQKSKDKKDIGYAINTEFNVTTNDKSLQDISYFNNVYGFISMLTATREFYSIDIPIFNSPQIRVNTGAGWKYEQSVFSFVKSNMNSGFGGALFSLLGIEKEMSKLVDGIEQIAGLAGWSPRLGPYWSLADNPFSNRPTLQVDVKLINDSDEHGEMNNLFLDTYIKNSLAGTGTARKSGGGESGNRVFGLWYPPKLFNVGLKWGATQKKQPNNYVKRYHLCTLDASITAEGIMRHGFPDAYSLSMTFSSLLPDVVDAWAAPDGFYREAQAAT